MFIYNVCALDTDHNTVVIAADERAAIRKFTETFSALSEEDVGSIDNYGEYEGPDHYEDVLAGLDEA